VAARLSFPAASSPISMSQHSILFALAGVVCALPACQDRGRISEQKAADEVGRVVPIVKEDVEQVRRGLPEGAAKLGPLLEADPGANLAGLQRSIAAARAGVKDLNLAKSTFFSFVDTNGVVLRSESDPDAAASKSILSAFPGLKKALEPQSGIVEAFGEMPELDGVKGKPDQQWAVAHPVKDAAGTVKGMFVTGWSMRRFAYHLEEMAKRDLHDEAQKNSDKSVPLIYVFAVKAGKAYGAPLTPDVNAEALDKLDLVSKTAAGPYRGQVVITERTFGVAAQRTPDLGPDTAVAVLLSEI